MLVAPSVPHAKYCSSDQNAFETSQNLQPNEHYLSIALCQHVIVW